VKKGRSRRTKEGRTNGGRTDGRAEGRAGGRKDGRTKGRTKGRTDGGRMERLGEKEKKHRASPTKVSTKMLPVIFLPSASVLSSDEDSFLDKSSCLCF
jgi:hypothetical protein